MTQPVQWTKAQRRRFYREAVRETLVAIYGKPEPASKALVSAWWKRVSKTDAFKSNLLFHAEPLHTAADIADVKSISITPENEEAYHRVLRRAKDLVLKEPRGAASQPPHTRPGVELKRDVHRSLQGSKARKHLEQKLLARG